MTKFIEKSLICRYEVLHHIVTDNVVHFQVKTAELLQRYQIEHHKSSPYRPQANGAIEAANKNVKKILSKRVKTYKDLVWISISWYMGIHNNSANSNRRNSILIGICMWSNLPIETEIKSLRVVIEAKIPESEWKQKRYEHLVSLDKKMMDALFYTQIYQKRIARSFNKKVKPGKIKARDMVLK